MPELHELDALLLSREWRDADGGIEIVLWGRAAVGPVRARIARQEAVMFVPHGAPAQGGRQVPRPLTSFSGTPVDAVYFRSQRALREERGRLADLHVPTFEGDLKPADRFLMERFVTGGLHLRGPATWHDGVLCFDGPRVTASEARIPLSLLALDLETEGLDGPILSAAIATADRAQVFVRGPAPAAPLATGRAPITFLPDERALIAALLASVVDLDPDVLCGWNVVDFDLTVLEARARRVGLPLTLGRAGERARVLPGSSPGRPSVARVPGRVVLDGIATLRSATWSFERFTLQHVAQELLGRGKAIAGGTDAGAEVLRMHAEDVKALATYNLEDCQLVLDIFEKADLLGFATERARLTGLAMDRQGGSVAAFDHLYLPRIHRRGVVAGEVDGEMPPDPSPGGHVLESTPGLFTDVLSFDFRSLYPSIIRTFQIDPLGMAQPGDDPIPGEEGAQFARRGAILPELITTLHEARSIANAAGNAALSRAIKILMNSFYGVLGTPGCRFFDPRLPTSITRRGHAIIERARRFFEDAGLPVIYGDTDSLFVHVRGGGTEAALRDHGAALAAALNAALTKELAVDPGIESQLELRFESHYLRFLMPTTRGSERGSKKRYAGMVRAADGSNRLVVRGLEAVRRDWTPLARRVQLELLRRTFEDEPFEGWLRDVVRDLQRGALDEELVYRKRLRGGLEHYAGSAPPHVQAARRLEALGGGATAEIAYLVTVRGPEPVGARSSPIDHRHYADRQLAPACDVVLGLVGTSFASITGAQTELFGATPC